MHKYTKKNIRLWLTLALIPFGVFCFALFLAHFCFDESVINILEDIDYEAEGKIKNSGMDNDFSYRVGTDIDSITKHANIIHFHNAKHNNSEWSVEVIKRDEGTNDE